MRNYVKVNWIKGDVYDDTNTYILTVYGYQPDADAQLAAYMANQSPLWTMQKSDAGSHYLLVSKGWVLAYLKLSGPLATCVSKFVFDAIHASETSIVGGDDSPRESQWGYKSEGGGGYSPKTSAGKPGTIRITLLSYLYLLLNTWEGVAAGRGGRNVPGTGGVPKRWIDWLTLLISHYSRYTPAQIYGFLGRVDFTKATFKV